MTSAIDVSQPPEGDATTAALRANFAAAMSEILALQRAVDKTQFVILNDNLADGTTAFVDTGPQGRTITVHGNAQYDTAQAPTGMTSSLLLDGTGDGISVIHASGFAFNQDDFAFEFAIRPNGTPAGHSYILCKSEVSAMSPFVIYQDATVLRFYASTDFSQWNVVNTGAFGTLVANTWHTIVLTRTGNRYQGYLNATRAFNVSSTTQIGANDAPISYGCANNGSESFNGWLGPCRFTVGTNRGYTGASITPPTFPFT